MKTRIVSQNSIICDRTCATSTVIFLKEGGAQLAKRWREALQRRPAGGGIKRPQAAWVKSPGGGVEEMALAETSRMDQRDERK
jgi:hypothetical protein